jgi:hypothetical protein
MPISLGRSSSASPSPRQRELVIPSGMRSIRKCRASFAVLSGGSGKLGWRTPADPGRRTRAVARGHEHGRTRCTGPDSDGRLAALSGGPHHCEPSLRQGRWAARRPAVPDRRVRRGPECARPDARLADHPGRRGPGTAPGDLSPARSLAVLAPTYTIAVVPGVEGTDIPLHGPLPARSCST